MRYDEAVSYVHSLLRFGVKPGLERMRAMMAEPVSYTHLDVYKRQV